MLFIKTSEKTVRCDITNAELQEIGLTAALVLDGDEKARGFLNELNQEVGRQLAYNPQEEVLLFTRNLLPNGDLRIDVIKLSNQDIEEAVERIRKAANGVLDIVTEDRVRDIKEKSGIEKANALNAMLQQVSYIMNSVTPPEEVKEQGSLTTKYMPEYYSFVTNFSDLNQVTRFCRMIKDFPIENAKLYKAKDIYYLFFDIEIMEESMLYAIQTIGIEYADDIQINPAKMSYIEENGECIVKKDAVKELGQIGEISATNIEEKES